MTKRPRATYVEGGGYMPTREWMEVSPREVAGLMGDPVIGEEMCQVLEMRDGVWWACFIPLRIPMARLRT